MNKYNVIYADPPWQYSSKSGADMKSGADAHYDDTMSTDDICGMPIPDMIDKKGAVIFLWATVPLMPDAFRVIDAWGFKYKTMLTWRKVMSLGMGWWFRGQCEHLILGVRGNVKAFRMQKPNFYQCKVGKHSQKPHHFRELINTATDRVFDDPKKLELFARDRNDMFPQYEFQGWDLYGNQVSNSIQLPQ